MVGKHVMTLRFPLCAVGQMELRCDGRMFLSHYLDSRPKQGVARQRCGKRGKLLSVSITLLYSGGGISTCLSGGVSTAEADAR